ncbi:MAG TPA: arginine--tRNA ligase [Acidimicrobiales bacterium]|jgi:arginyl-tRNA synthetase|nr:arginine--tRNA ligase [Acidimicrobiales bacterium]
MVRDTLAESVRATLVALGLPSVPDVVHLERPARPEHGDWSTNVALALAKVAGRNPRELATAIADHLRADPPPHVVAVDVAGPGFVNFRLDDGWLHDVLVQVVGEGVDGYARHKVGGGERVNVEFVSANPTGPLHVGAGRWAAYGDSLCRLLERCGWAVHREYYVNDRGNQMTLFVESLSARKAGQPVPEGGYQGRYVSDWAAEMPEGVDVAAWGYERVTRDLADTLAAIGVRFDTWFSERSLVSSGALEATLAGLRTAGALYEADGATWFRATDHGDRQDHVLVKSDGDPTYLLSDIAYHRDKFARGFDHLVDIWGADHHGHVARVKAGITALGHDPQHLEIILGQLVTLERSGEVVRMGRRTGEFVELADVLAEVGPDVARLIFLLQSVDTRQTFDIEVVRRQSMDNPVYYVQYAHARIASIGRVATERGVERPPLADTDLSLLVHPRELDLLRSLDELSEVVLSACLTRAPHKVTTWVLDLAGRFHGFYHDCSVLGPENGPALTEARLWLVEATRVGLAVALGLLGVTAPEAM